MQQSIFIGTEENLRPTAPYAPPPHKSPLMSSVKYLAARYRPIFHAFISHQITLRRS